MIKPFNKPNKRLRKIVRSNLQKKDPYYIIDMNIAKNIRKQHEILHQLQNHYHFSNTNLYTFVHPTKCGGTAVEDFLHENYQQYFQLIKGHGQTCLNHNNPIIIVRDPIDRFKSIYKYWKYGSDKFTRKKEFNEKFGQINIKDFIQLLKNNDTKTLYRGYTWDLHFKPITNWIKNTKLENIIILKYKNDIDSSVQKLVQTLNLNIVPKNVSHVNITKKIDEKIILDEQDMTFIREYYCSDFELWNKINNNPELFRHVI